jgi:ribonuclease G
MQSAFVDIGLERDAFLYVSDFFDEEEEFERIVIDKSKKGTPDAERAAAEEIAQNRVEREQRIEATQERVEPLQEEGATIVGEGAEPAEGGRRRGRRGRRRSRWEKTDQTAPSTPAQPEAFEVPDTRLFLAILQLSG